MRGLFPPILHSGRNPLLPRNPLSLSLSARKTVRTIARSVGTISEYRAQTSLLRLRFLRFRLLRRRLILPVRRFPHRLPCRIPVLEKTEISEYGTGRTDRAQRMEQTVRSDRTGRKAPGPALWIFSRPPIRTFTGCRKMTTGLLIGKTGANGVKTPDSGLIPGVRRQTAG